MNRLKLFSERIISYFNLRKDYVPIATMVLFGIVILSITAVTLLFISPVTRVDLEKFEKDDLNSEDYAKLASAQRYESPDIEEFDPLEEHNLFRSSRTDWATKPRPTPTPKPRPTPTKEKVDKEKLDKEKLDKEEEKKKEKKKPRPKIKPDRVKLSAIMMFDETRVALIENVDKSKSKEKYIYVKVGEDVGGYTVKSIESTKIVLEWYDEIADVLLYKE